MSPALHLPSPFSSNQRDLIAHQRMLKRLNGRIAIVVAIVAAELWALEASLEAWAHGESVAMFLAFQLVGFMASLATLEQLPATAWLFPRPLL